MNRIKEMRIKSKKTQQEIAELLCINRTTYTKWENATHAPDIASLQRLAGILNTSVSYLLEETNNPMSEQKKEPGTISDDGLKNPLRSELEKKIANFDDTKLKLLLERAELLDRMHIKEDS